MLNFDFILVSKYFLFN